MQTTAVVAMQTTAVATATLIEKKKGVLNFLAQLNFNHLQFRLLTNRLASRSHSLPTVGCVNVTVRYSGACAAVAAAAVVIVAAVVDVVEVSVRV
eukprot:10842-Heterococcus_DN1.PRE.1